MVSRIMRYSLISHNGKGSPIGGAMRGIRESHSVEGKGKEKAKIKEG